MRPRPSPAVLQRPGEAAAPLQRPAPIWQQPVTAAEDGAHRAAGESVPCAGTCSGGAQQGLAGSGSQAGSPVHSRRKVVSVASCGSAGLVSPAEQPLALTATPACEY